MAVMAAILAALLAVPALGDTLIMRNGRRYSGTLMSANARTIMFRDPSGVLRRFFVNDVDAVQFGDAAERQDNQEPRDDHQGGGRRDDQGYGRRDNPGSDNRQGVSRDDDPGNHNPQSDRRDDNQRNTNDPQYVNQDNHIYDQAAMERVVLPAGTEVDVRTNERIDSRDVVEGQSFSAQLNEDIRDQGGSVVVPRGAEVRLITRRLEENGDITLDVDSITVQGRRYRVSTTDQELQNRRDGVGGNKRTGQFVGGGAILGAIIGAVAGGGRGAAIGAVSGAGAGAAAQIITRGREVHVPAESVLRFQLDRPLRLRLWQ